MRHYKLLISSIASLIICSILIVSCKKTIDQEATIPKGEQLAGRTADPKSGSIEFCGLNAKGTHEPAAGKSVSQTTTVFNTDFTSAAVGGMRGVGSGTISLSGVSGTVTKAYLYWHGLSPGASNVGNPIMVNGTPVTGTNIGVSSDNCWGQDNSQAYRADVTALVLATGNGNYNLSSFGSMNPNGASLIVFFNDANSLNNRDVVIFDGNDSNIAFAGIAGNPNAPADPEGWNVTLAGINYTSGTANIQLHVADGQSFGDGAIVVNASVLVPAGGNFQGNSVPGVDMIGAGGNLWDVKTYNVTSYLTPGPNTLNMTSDLNSDCLGLIAALIDLPAGAAPPPDCVTTANCKNATVTLVNGTVTVPASAVNNNSTATCGIQSMTVAPNTFSCSNIGTNNVVLTVTDNNGNTSTCNAVVTVVGEIPSCTVTATPSNNVYTGGVPTNLYIGYGPQSVTLNVNAPSSGNPYTYSWTPSAGLSSSTSGAPVFTPTAAGVYTFTVTVTNVYGCTSTCSITITVIDVRCGKNMDKVIVCHKFGTPAQKDLCIGADGVADHLAHGDTLGPCN